MSAFICSDAHISAIVVAARAIGCPGAVSFADLPGRDEDRFALLYGENRKSMISRYGREMEKEIPKRGHFRPDPMLPAVNVMKLIQSYQYQACEHDGWEESTARRWTDLIFTGLVYRLPGYDAAPWAID